MKKVSFGDTTGLSIKRDDPARRKSFRARHNCDNPTLKQKQDTGHVINGEQTHQSIIKVMPYEKSNERYTNT